jgi:hypothetical protein
VNCNRKVLTAKLAIDEEIVTGRYRWPRVYCNVAQTMPGAGRFKGCRRELFG